MRENTKSSDKRKTQTICNTKGKIMNISKNSDDLREKVESIVRAKLERPDSVAYTYTNYYIVGRIAEDIELLCTLRDKAESLPGEIVGQELVKYFKDNTSKSFEIHKRNCIEFWKDEFGLSNFDIIKLMELV
jgi:hypothetical protein